MIEASFTIERRHSSQFQMIFGMDEAGRGPLAGPVVAVAARYRLPGFLMPRDAREAFRFVRDSKKLSEKDREYAYSIVLEYFETGVGMEDVATIDRVNILQATFLAMREAVFRVMSGKQRGARIIHNKGRTMHEERQAMDGEKRMRCGEHVMLDKRSEKQDILLLVDGNRVIPEMPYAQEAVVKGDSLSFSIAAASIVAKITRDRLMRELDAAYPQYGFAQNKGYGTAEHLLALRRFGPTPVHRRSFAPVMQAGR